MTYNLSFMEGNSTLEGVAQGLNDGLNGVFGSGIMFTLMIVIFIALINRGLDVALIASSFIGAFIGGLFVALGIMNAGILIVPLLILIGGVIVNRLDKN